MKSAFAAVVFDSECRVLLCKHTINLRIWGGTCWTFPGIQAPDPEKPRRARGGAQRDARLDASQRTSKDLAEGIHPDLVLECIRRQTGYGATIIGTTRAALPDGGGVTVFVLSAKGKAGPFEPGRVDAIAWALPKAAPWILGSGTIRGNNDIDMAVLSAACRLYGVPGPDEGSAKAESAEAEEAPKQADLPALRAAAESGDRDAMFTLAFELSRREYAMDDESYAEAAKWFRILAQEGDATAMYNLGVLLSSDDNPYRDIGEAINWFQGAARAGHEDALFNLGIIYYKGDGVEQDYAKALGFLQRAAEKGEMDSMFMLGRIYRDGLGVEQDGPAALEWFRKGAALGDDASAYFAGLMLEEGDGVPQDCAEARKFY